MIQNGRGSRKERRVQARESRHFYACIHTTPRCILRTFARTKRSCVCERCIAIAHIHMAACRGPDTPDKYLHMGLRGNFLKTQVPRVDSYHRPLLHQTVPRFAALSFTSHRFRLEKEDGEAEVGKFVMPPKTLPLENPTGDRATSLETVARDTETLRNCRRVCRLVP